MPHKTKRNMSMISSSFELRHGVTYVLHDGQMDVTDGYIDNSDHPPSEDISKSHPAQNVRSI